MGIIKQCTHPHLLPPTPGHPKYFPTHPHLLKIMLHPPPLTLTHPKHIPTNPHPPEIMSHTPPPTPTYPKYFPTHSHLPKIMPHPHKKFLISPHSPKIRFSNPHLLSSSKLLIYQVTWPFDYESSNVTKCRYNAHSLLRHLKWPHVITWLNNRVTL